ncbi:Histidine kinase 3 [Nymphaea thermarum]|nr:Histidine kinase 3 [Nymphaea thermarum]
MCDERARMLQDQFNVSMNHVHALAIMVSTFHHGKMPSAIDQKTFAEYTDRTAFERPLTSGVAYAQRVLHAEREQFEKQQGWTIKVMDEQDKNPVRDDEHFAEFHEVSPVQEEYAPVIFAQDTVAHVISLDMLSGPEDRENILRARASGRGVLTAPFSLLKSKRLGVILTFAVYNKELPLDAKPEERIESTIGYIGGIFDIESLVEKLLHQLASKQTIVVNVYDTTNASHSISMYGPTVLDNRQRHVSPLNFGDPFRKHEMQCRQDGSFPYLELTCAFPHIALGRFKQKPPLPWLAITTSLGILVIALLVGHIFYAAMARIAKVEDDYREMMELKVRAEAADVAKSQFLATVSHEIRTPMNGVLGMLQMLMDTDLDETQLDYVKTAQASGKALISLINEVLDQAKIESGKLELEAVQFNLRAVLDDVLSLFSGKSQDKGIELAVYVSDKVPEILIGDPGRFRQIITNLVGNSIKFTERGHILVSVQLVDGVKSSSETALEPPFKLYQDCIRNGYGNSCNTLSGFPVVERRRSWETFKSISTDALTCNQVLKANPADAVNVLVSVEDTGVGIPVEAQGRVFTPFMQADSSTSRTHGGTGIGLSISKCLVDLMKGEIGFASERNIGSTFAFTAVFTKVQTKSNEPKGHRQQYEQDFVISEFQRMTALIVDPRPVRAAVTKYHLQRLGIRVQISSDPSQGLSTILSGKENINLVFIDEEAWVKHAYIFSSFIVDKSKNGALSGTKFFLLAKSITSAEVNASKFLDRCPLTVITKPLRAGMLSSSLQRAVGIERKQNCRSRELRLASLKSILHGKRILVVDDNAVNLKVAACALKKYGANVECAESGKIAVAKLTPPHEFDACFMDVQMPEMDGFEATRRIRDMETSLNDRVQKGEASEVHGNLVHWHTPILAMTADVIQATHEHCLQAGMDGYVSKPFEESQLYGEVARFLQSNSSSD